VLGLLSFHGNTVHLSLYKICCTLPLARNQKGKDVGKKELETFHPSTPTTAAVLPIATTTTTCGGSYIQNTQHLHYKDQPVKVINGNDHHSLENLYKAHKYNKLFNVKANNL
jgi:hypothetical protein